MFYFLSYPFFFTVCRVLLRVFGRVRSRGEHHVPAQGPVLYCPNHLSDSDPPTVFICLPRRAWSVAKDDLQHVPVLGWILSRFHVIFIKRDSPDRRALRQCEEVLRRGEPLMIFPEGRCSQTETLLPVQPGAAMLSLRTGAPIVPIGLKNTNKVLPYGKLRPRFSREPVEVIFGAPIEPSHYAGLKKSEAIAALTEDLIAALSELTGRSPSPELR